MSGYFMLGIVLDTGKRKSIEGENMASILKELIV